MSIGAQGAFFCLRIYHFIFCKETTKGSGFYQSGYGTTLTAREVPTKTGYTFSGWSEIPATMPDEDVIITGTFNVNSYVITLPEKIELCEGYSITDGKVSYGSELKFKAADGYIASNVKIGSTVLEPDENGIYSITVKENTVVTAEILLLGDVNFDKNVDDKDAAMVLKYISYGKAFFDDDNDKNEKAKLAANADGIGNVDMLDVIKILEISEKSKSTVVDPDDDWFN